MLNQKSKFWCLAVIVLFSCFAFISTSYAVPTFYLSPGSALDGDHDFQNSLVGSTLVEEDFDSYSNGTVIDSLSYGNIEVSLTASSIAKPASFWGTWGADSAYGNVFKGALERNTWDSNSNFLQFSFSGSEIVKGFGVWVFDDSC